MRRLLTLVAVLCCSAAHAHDARPVAVTISETLPGIYEAQLRVPPTVESDNVPALIWPASCEATGEAGSLVRCSGDLQGQVFALDYPRFNPSLATYYRLQPIEDREASAILAPNEATWTVPEAATRGDVARDYLLLGVEHIIGGPDHLLFVLGLLVIARSARRILLAVTGFTLAHSLTLSLSSLGLVNIPIAPVEAAIALSILFLAHEISSPRADSLTWRQPMLVSFSFGLLHGLGFASALGEIGLVRGEVVVSLLFFNLGVELGQVLFILAVVGAVIALHRIADRIQGAEATPAGEGAVLQRRLDLLAAYIIGVPSAYWLIERVASFS